MNFGCIELNDQNEKRKKRKRYFLRKKLNILSNIIFIKIDFDIISLR